QVVELAHLRVARLEHLDVQLAGHRVQAVGVEARRHPVHGLAPGPERVLRMGLALGHPGHRALERMRMQVGDARQLPAAVHGARREDGIGVRVVHGGVPAAGCDRLPRRRHAGPQLLMHDSTHIATDDAPRWDGLVTGARLATLDAAAGYGLVEDGALGWRDGRIVFAGPARGLPAAPDRLAHEVVGAGGDLAPPVPLDCHAHVVFAGGRAAEFELRLSGASYEEIARAGGGIVSTVRATRAAGEAGLLAESLPRARALVADGVTTLEVKSGYGLDLAH